MKKLLSLIFCLMTIGLIAQEEQENSREIGLEGFVNASSLGGTFGAGIKYALVNQGKIAYGPSIRLHRFWSNFAGVKTGFNIYGGGAFFHYRLKNLLFLGTEFEVLHTPTYYNFGVISPSKQWIPTFFVGGGFSKRFDIGLRLNAGMFYDIINNLNSPFRLSYISKKENGTLVPIIYRIGIFFDV